MPEVRLRIGNSSEPTSAGSCKLLPRDAIAGFQPSAVHELPSDIRRLPSTWIPSTRNPLEPAQAIVIAVSFLLQRYLITIQPVRCIEDMLQLLVVRRGKEDLPRKAKREISFVLQRALICGDPDGGAIFTVVSYWICAYRFGMIQREPGR